MRGSSWLLKAPNVRVPSPLEVFSCVVQGVVPPVNIQRAFLAHHFTDDLAAKGIHDSKLAAMDYRTCSRLLRRLVLHKYLSIPLRLYAFDMEFTDIPRFTAEGPTSDIIEIGVFSPARDARMSVLVKTPEGRRIPDSTVELTGITNEMLDAEGVPFLEAWTRVEAFLNTPEPDEPSGAEVRQLLLSHGGKLADVSMLQWALKRHQKEMPQNIVFGDTFGLIRDAHRRRPVTPDKHPPSWRLSDLVGWLKVESDEHAHRAGDDAKMTWDALYHTLERYGDDTLTPRQQLVLRFFDDVVRRELRLSGHSTHGGSSVSTDLSTLNSLDLDGIFETPSSASSSQSTAAADTQRLGDTGGLDDDGPGKSLTSTTARASNRRPAQGKRTPAKSAKEASLFKPAKAAAASVAHKIQKSEVVTDVPDL